MEVHRLVHNRTPREHHRLHFPHSPSNLNPKIPLTIFQDQRTLQTVHPKLRQKPRNLPSPHSPRPALPHHQPRPQNHNPNPQQSFKHFFSHFANRIDRHPNLGRVQSNPADNGRFDQFRPRSKLASVSVADRSISAK